jgi:hypothetical protein
LTRQTFSERSNGFDETLTEAAKHAPQGRTSTNMGQLDKDGILTLQELMITALATLWFMGPGLAFLTKDRERDVIVKRGRGIWNVCVGPVEKNDAAAWWFST